MLKAEHIKSIDWIFIFSIVFLICIGLAAIYSATRESEGVLAELAPKQLNIAIVSLFVFTFMMVISVRVTYAFAYIFYGIGVLVVIAVLVLNRGPEPARWIHIGGLNFQPSEVAKITTIFALARFLSDSKKVISKLSTTIRALLIAGIPAFFVMIEPDLGSASVFGFTALPMIFFSGINIVHIFVLVMPALVIGASLNIFILIPVIIIFILVMMKLSLKPAIIVLLTVVNIGLGITGPLAWKSLHPYQQRRIMTFLNPEADPRGAGYQIIQSKIAVGSGGFAGKGYLKGTQSHLHFLPAGHTDFIFSVYCEEFGFLGAGMALLAFYLIVLRGTYFAQKCRNSFSALVLVGGAAHFGSHALVNIGMAIGLLPVTGIPLPFMSYGGTALILNMIIAGAMAGMSMRWKEY